MTPHFGWPVTVVVAIAWAVVALHIVLTIGEWLTPAPQ